MTARSPARSLVRPVVADWARCPVTPAVAMAVRAMHSNNASPDQQRLFMIWLNTQCSELIGLGWSADDERISNFMAGRRFVALKIAEILKTPPEAYDTKGTK